MAQTKEICITVDDLPTVPYGKRAIEHSQYITQKLVSTFKKHKVPAIGYVNERKLYVKGKPDKGRLELLEMWLEGGLELGNHTYSHIDYHKTSMKQYGEEILKGQQHISTLSKKYGRQLKFFRHPYLHIGKSQLAYDSLNDFLSKHGYIEAPVTIDNADYLFAKAYFIAYNKSDSITMQKIGNDYIDYMERKVNYFESRSDKLFARSIKQILLFHASLLNADYADELMDMLERNGYTFISQEEVLKDKVYETKITAFGPWGISWIDRWAMSQGVSGDFFKDDPETPVYIIKMTE